MFQPPPHFSVGCSRTEINKFIHGVALIDIAMATIYMPFWITSLSVETWIFS